MPSRTLEPRLLLSLSALVAREAPSPNDFGDPSKPFGGHRPGDVVELGTVARVMTFQDEVLDAGTQAWYRFTTTRTAGVDHFVAVTSESKQAGLSIELYGPRGRSLGVGSKGLPFEEIDLNGLPAATYYARVFSPEGASSPNYSLKISSPSRPIRGDRIERLAPNHTPATAFPLGRVDGSRTVEKLSLAHEADYFRFRLGRGVEASEVVIGFDASQGDLDLEVFRVEGTARRPRLVPVDSSGGSGNAERIQLHGDLHGIYVVKVFSGEGDFNPDYSLTINTGQAVETPPAGSLSAGEDPGTPRAVPAGWFDENLADPTLTTLVAALYGEDDQLSRADFLTIFTTVAEDSLVSEDEYRDLVTIVDASALAMPASVRNLAGKVVGPEQANAWFRGEGLGDLAPGSPADQLRALVDKWFLGRDHPAVNVDDRGIPEFTYREAVGVLFPEAGPVFSDINQGALGDCYFLAGLASVALHSPDTIQDMITPNGDGTFTVRFAYDQDGWVWADYLTVDSALPVERHGRLVYAQMGSPADDPGAILWPALLEKAYAQWAETGRNASAHDAENSYLVIEGGNSQRVFNQVYGTLDHIIEQVPGSSPRRDWFLDLATVFAQGGDVGFGTSRDPALDTIAGSHAYTLVGFDAAAQTITIFNPWGMEGGKGSDDQFKPGLVTLTLPEFRSSIDLVYRKWGMA